MGNKDSKPRTPSPPKKKRRGCGGGSPKKKAAATVRMYNTDPTKMDWHCLDTTVLTGFNALKNIDSIETFYKDGLTGASYCPQKKLLMNDNLKTYQLELAKIL